MSEVVALRHVRFEDLGLLEPLFAERGLRVRYVDAAVAEIEETLLERARIVVVLGGPIGANEEDSYPFLRQELALIEKCLEARIPLLGICLGAQNIAKVLGAQVYSADAKEIGWSRLQLTQAGRQSWLRHLEESRVLHWHGDIFDLPEGATHLAATEMCANQAFSWQSHVLGLQFHAEVRARSVEEWLVGHVREIRAAGISVRQLRTDTRRWGAFLEQAAVRCFSAWLDDVLTPIPARE